MTIEYRQKALEALAHYNITATEIELLRHNENLTYRVGNKWQKDIGIQAVRSVTMCWMPVLYFPC